MPTILVVEDEEHLRATLAYTLRKAGYGVATAATGPAALVAFQAQPPDLVLLDVMLPELDGFAVCRHIRQRSGVPILMLTARADELDTVAGLELGADDYIAKPFRLRELLARVAAALRRASRGDRAPPPVAPILRAGDLTLDPATHTACRGARPLTLTPRAFALLRFFMAHPNQVFTRDQLLRQLWDDPFIGDPRTVAVHVRWIREQIEDDPSQPQRLRTIRHVGYQFVGKPMLHRPRSIRWRLAGASIVLLVVTLTLLSLALLQLLRSTYLRTLEAGLAGQARLVATLADARPAQLELLARDASAELNARVTLIAADGTVLADSRLPPAARENLGDRPEVRDALALGAGASERNSVATGDDMFYVAVPFVAPPNPRGVARVGVPLTRIAEAQTRLAVTVFVAAVLAAAVALAIAIWIARRTTRPLLELRTMAARLAGGDLAAQVPIPPDAEVAALAQDFNVMASRLRQLLATVEAERQRLATVLATMADGILMLDGHARVTLANRAAERMVAVAPDRLPVALATLPIGELLLPGLQQARRAQPEQPPVVIEALSAPATGRSLRAVITPLLGTDDEQALVVLQDLTELRRAEQARRAFLANISHDLRTPLASLQAMIETLQDGALDDRPVALDFLTRMAAEVDSLTRLVTEFLELSRIETGALELHSAPTDLGALLREVVDRMQAQATQHGVTLVLRLPTELPTLLIDGPRIAQVLLNLLQNALAFTPAGGTVTLSAVPADDHVAVTVRDTGVGIALDDLPHVFERFYKGDRARSGGGTGLGLAIARHLVERHGGRIWAASQPPAGATVTFTLPLDPHAR